MFLVSTCILLFADTLPSEYMFIQLHTRRFQSADFAQLVTLTCVILLCIVLFNVCRDRNTDRIFVTFPKQFVMLQKLTELSLSIHMQLYFWVLSFLTV